MIKKQCQKERELFRQALIEAMANKYDKELEKCPEEIECSENHTQKMSAIVHAHAISERRKALKRKLIAAFVAAALLVLTACTVYANREEIKKTFVRIFDSYLQLSYEESGAEKDQPISEQYTLGYVPDGYKLDYKQEHLFESKSHWKNSSGDFISLHQSRWDGTICSIDFESGESLSYVVNGKEIYYRHNDVHTYIWNDGTYSFVLTSSIAFSESDLQQIIEGLVLTD